MGCYKGEQDTVWCTVHAEVRRGGAAADVVRQAGQASGVQGVGGASMKQRACLLTMVRRRRE